MRAAVDMSSKRVAVVHTSTQQWVAAPSVALDGRMQWVHSANRVKCSLGHIDSKRRFALAVRVILRARLVRKVESDGSNPALVWMLGARHGGDAVRHPSCRPESVRLTARRMVCGPPRPKPDEVRFVSGRKDEYPPSVPVGFV